jgi:hypothetical protein
LILCEQEVAATAATAKLEAGKKTSRKSQIQRLIKSVGNLRQHQGMKTEKCFSKDVSSFSVQQMFSCSRSSPVSSSRFIFSLFLRLIKEVFMSLFLVCTVFSY